uniref:Uncharacterized protein n=1 Tax=Arundo donax TaxID=35708 RepID=A0A0A9GFF9_ARUDO
MNLQLRLPKNLRVRPLRGLLGRLACLEHEHRIACCRTKEPTMDVPKHLYRQPIHQDRLVPSKLPWQPLHPHHQPPINADLKTRVLNTHGVAFYGNVMAPAIVAELSLGRVNLLANNVLPPGNEQCVSQRPAGAGLPVRLFPHVAEQEHYLDVAYHGDVERFQRLGAGAELGAGQVPEDVDVGGAAGDVEALGPFPLGEEPRLDVGFAQSLPGRGVVDGDAERGLPHEAAPVPRHRDHAGPAGEPRLVEARHQALRRRAALAEAGDGGGGARRGGRRGRCRVRDLDAGLPEAGQVPHHHRPSRAFRRTPRGQCTPQERDEGVASLSPVLDKKAQPRKTRALPRSLRHDGGLGTGPRNHQRAGEKKRRRHGEQRRGEGRAAEQG